MTDIDTAGRSPLHYAALDDGVIRVRELLQEGDPDASDRIGGWMERFAREDVLALLRRFGVSSARRATTTDSSEEVVLLKGEDFASVDVRALTLAVMDVLRESKVWVVEDGPHWRTEQI